MAELLNTTDRLLPVESESTKRKREAVSMHKLLKPIDWLEDAICVLQNIVRLFVKHEEPEELLY